MNYLISLNKAQVTKKANSLILNKMKDKCIVIISIVISLILTITFGFNTAIILTQYQDTTDYNFLFQAEHTKQKQQLRNCYSYLEDAKKESIYTKQLESLKQLDSCLKNSTFTQLASSTVEDLSIRLGAFKILNDVFFPTKLKEEESIDSLIVKVFSSIKTLMSNLKTEVNQEKINLEIEHNLSKIDMLLSYFIHTNKILFYVNMICLMIFPVLIELVFLAICALIIISFSFSL